jgi:hypothetical protein
MFLSSPAPIRRLRTALLEGVGPSLVFSKLFGAWPEVSLLRMRADLSLAAFMFSQRRATRFMGAVNEPASGDGAVSLKGQTK